MARRFTKFFNAVTSTMNNIIDPDRKKRIDVLVNQIRGELKKQQRQFDIDKFVEKYDPHPEELRDAISVAIQKFVAKAWTDGVLSEKESAQLEWIRVALQLDIQDLRELNRPFAIKFFRSCLEHIRSNRSFSSFEENRLNQLSESIGKTAGSLLRTSFEEEWLEILKILVVAKFESGQLTPESWLEIKALCKRFDTPESKLLLSISETTHLIVEHLLADAKSEGEVSAECEAEIVWYLKTFQIDPVYAGYVRSEIDLLRDLKEISDGKLPSLTKVKQIELRAGEIVHADIGATLVVIKYLKSGESRTDHHGRLIVLDSRFIFQGPTFAQVINYKKIITHRGTADWVEFQFGNKPTWGFLFPDPQPLLYPILSKAIALSNQTAFVLNGNEPSRHIPRDVRQRVWTRYGGKCVECCASEYLEFDHIVPFSKGGSNSDNNVQLLCRRCNLKKSDFI